MVSRTSHLHVLVPCERKSAGETTRKHLFAFRTNNSIEVLSHFPKFLAMKSSLQMKLPAPIQTIESRSTHCQDQERKLIDYTKRGRRSRSQSSPPFLEGNNQTISNNENNSMISNNSGKSSSAFTAREHERLSITIKDLEIACSHHQMDGTEERVQFLMKIPSRDIRNQRVNNRESLYQRLRKGENRRRSLSHTSGIIERSYTRSEERHSLPVALGKRCGANVHV